MCGVDGMVIDDGTVIRLADDRFLLTTTTGNAATVLDWMEEWLQTEWPHLRVRLHVGHRALGHGRAGRARARATCSPRVAPELAVDNDAFPFMTWRDAGSPGCRRGSAGSASPASSPTRSTSAAGTGWRCGRRCWRPGPIGITPYGTETMHVLRAEKGYPIIGQDTDGTVTPHDLGMAWVVSKKKPDFIGKRSFARAENQRPDRKHLVGAAAGRAGPCCCRRAPSSSARRSCPSRRCRCSGHVTSSYRSAALGGTFALALVKAGRERIGETLYSPVGRPAGGRDRRRTRAVRPRRSSS